MLWRAVAVSWHSGASTECARAWRLENDDNGDYGDGDDGDDSDYDFEDDDDDDTDYFKEKHLVTESKIFGRGKFFNGFRCWGKRIVSCCSIIAWKITKAIVTHRSLFSVSEVQKKILLSILPNLPQQQCVMVVRGTEGGKEASHVGKLPHYSTHYGHRPS